MTPTPTGALFHTDAGTDLVLTRTFRASADDVWASLTEPHRTARWFGPWEGDAGPGKTIKVQMAFEEGAQWSDMHIDACEPPNRLTVSVADEAGRWRMELLLSEAGGSTELRLIHHLDSTDMIGEIGPGWEYYLDMLVAARNDSPQVDFADYYPAMKPYFDRLATPPSA
ncbi:SRPBCC family protein [Phytoactinopolyspora endophytica]|uniref:SRPBCC family protein n=1 Tax=Phytoactinopolyspora endophytica TaxID=1642495 RepID=UPI00101CDFD4|nr:SRPBCC family protein [Phytoactinopolyspora endophytica]